MSNRLFRAYVACPKGLSSHGYTAGQATQELIYLTSFSPKDRMQTLALHVALLGSTAELNSLTGTGLFLHSKTWLAETRKTSSNVPK